MDQEPTLHPAAKASDGIARLTRAAHCFRLADRVIAVICIPVGLRLLSPSSSAGTLAIARPEITMQLSEVLSLSADARVVIHPRICTVTDIQHASASDLRHFAQALERDGIEAPPLGAGCVLYSQPDPDWTMIYLLGVAIYPPPAALDLETPAVRERTSIWNYLVREAVNCADPEHWSLGIESEAQTEGVFYLEHGLRAGEDVLAALQLGRFVARIGAGGQGVRFCYARDPARAQIRLLATCGERSAEFVWHGYPHATESAFLEALYSAIEKHAFNVEAIHALELPEYQSATGPEVLRK